ncbi:MAG TPA: GrpB family protein [bacterium]|nr:GrpB family protein [bacterium]
MNLRKAQKPISEMTADELGRLFPISLSDHDPAWKDSFEAEKRLIEELTGVENIVRISHVGSTSVPGIKAKPIIDILFEVAEFFDKTAFIKRFVDAGYNYIPQPKNSAPHIMLVKGYTDSGFAGQVFHIHVRFSGDWEEIKFCEYMRQHLEIAKEYEQLKIELAQIHKYNRENYTNAKTDFITKINEIIRSRET